MTPRVLQDLESGCFYLDLEPTPSESVEVEAEVAPVSEWDYAQGPPLAGALPCATLDMLDHVGGAPWRNSS